MKGILVIAHGSRRKETIETMEAVYNMAKSKLPDVPMALAYMEFCHINLAKGLDILREQGVDHITVVPYFLFTGMHITKDIPSEIEEYLKKYPNLKVKVGETLGADPRIADVLSDRITSAL